jgi:type II secretory pathway pseudopilin PulG
MKKYNWGLSLVELVIAMTIMVIIMTAIMPQFRAIQNSWASSEASANMIQNGRVLEEHINRNLSAAKQIVSVSPGSTTNGFIIFKDVADVQKRYMVSGGYVVFGTLGSEEQLAGPVSRFQISCYSLDNINTPITDANNIRLVEVETDFTNSNPLGTNRTFIASAYLQTNANVGCSLVGWWKLDETSGTTAADSSVSGNSGTLVNMSAPSCWGAGQIGNALIFDGTNDHVTLPIGSVINLLTNSTIATWVNWSGSGSSWQHIWDFGTGTTYYMFLTPNNSANQMRFAITRTGSAGEEQTTYTTALPSGGWHHVAVTIDADNHIHKLYLDGSLVAQKTSANLKPSDLGNTDKNYLARSNYAADPYFNGFLDDVRIYSGVLTAAEILQLANTLKYMGFNEAKAASDLTSLAVPIPTGTSSGDLLIAAVATDEDTSTTITTAAGWTQIDRGVSGGAVTLGAWYKVAGASESAPTFTWTGGQQAYGWMMRFTGQDATNPINGTPVAASSTSATPTSPAVTTTVDNCIILRLGAFNDSSITVGSPGLSTPLHTPITMNQSGGGAAAPIYQAAGILVGGTGAQTVGWPTHQSGDVALLIIETANEAVTLSTSAGFVQVTNSPQGTGTAGGTTATRLAVYWKRATTSTEASPVVADSGNHQIAQIITFRGVIASGNPWDVTAGNVAATASTSVSIPGATTTVANTLVVAIVCNGTDTAAVQNSGWTNANFSLTERIDSGTTSGNGGGFGVATGVEATAGNYGTTTATLATSSVQGRMSIALKPSTAVTGTVSGGAGYVKQSTAGSSGTSNFTLGSSNEARTLTIAIAPDSTSNDGCSGGITP